MSGVTGLEVTYGAVVASKSHRRITNPLNRGNDRDNAFLWFRKDGFEEPIVEIRVLYDDDEPPEGFDVLRKDVTKGAVPGEQVFLAFRRKDVESDEYAIGDLAIVYDDDALPDDTPDWFGETLKEGERCDCQREDGKWYRAEVAADLGRSLKIHFEGWPSTYDITISRRSDRLQPLDTHTAGRNTRLHVKQGDEFSVNFETLDDMERRIEQCIAGELDLLETETLVRGELPGYLEMALSSVIELEMQPRVNQFNQAVLKLIAWYLAKPEPLRPEMRQQLHRLYLGDNKCNHFFNQRNTALRGDSEEGARYRGPAARLPPGGASRHFIANINFFHRCNGYELLIRRIDSPDFLMPLEELESILASVIDVPWRCYSEEFVAQTWPRLLRATLNRVLRMTDAEWKKHSPDWVEKQIIRQVFQTHSSLTGGTSGNGHQDPLQESVEGYRERFDASLALRLIRCDSLAVRVRGVNLIREICEKVRRKEGRLPRTEIREQFVRHGYYSSMGSFQTRRITLPIAEHFDSPTLSRWIKENGVIEAILGNARGNDRSGLVYERATPRDQLDVPLSVLSVTDVKPGAGPCGDGLDESAFPDPDAPEDVPCLATGEIDRVAQIVREYHAKQRQQQEQKDATEAAAAGEAAEEEGGAAGAAAAGAGAASASAVKVKEGGPETKMELGPLLGTHRQLVVRVPELVIFLAEEGDVTEEQLDLLWNCTKGSDEAMRRATLQGITEISQSLSQPLVDVLFSRIAKTPADQLDSLTIDLIRNFTSAALQDPDSEPESSEADETANQQQASTSVGTNSLYGLPMLWDAAHSSNVSEEVAQLAAKAVVSLVTSRDSSSVLRAQLRPLLLRAVENLRRGAHPVRSMRMAQALLERVPVYSPPGTADTVTAGASTTTGATAETAATSAQPVARQPRSTLLPSLDDIDDEWDADDDYVATGDSAATGSAAGGAVDQVSTSLEDSQEGVICFLDKETQVIQLVIEEMARYKDAVLRRAREAGVRVWAESGGEDASAATPSAAGMNEVKVSNLPHSEEIRTRLGFLGFLLTRASALELSLAQLERLWQMLVTQAMSPAERSAFFRWLRDTQFGITSPGTAVSESVAVNLFRDRLCNREWMQFERMGTADYLCFESFFLFVNGVNGKLVNYTSADDVMARQMDLEGLESLWHIVLRTQRDAVRRQSMDFVCRLHLRLADDATVKPEEAWGGFVDESVERAKELLDIVDEKGVDAATSERDSLQVLVQTLQQFMEEVEQANRVCHDSENNILITVHVYDPLDPDRTRGRVVRKLYFEVNRHSSLHELRERIARKLGVPASTVRMENWKRQYYDSKSTEYCEVEDFWCYKGVHAMPLPAPDFTTRGHKDEPYRYIPDFMHTHEDAVARAYPMVRMMNHPDSFATLMRLLNLPSNPRVGADADVGTLAWDLVTSLPSNTALRKDVASLHGAVPGGVSVPGEYLEEEDESYLLEQFRLDDDAKALPQELTDSSAIPWSRLFDASNPGKLLYSLDLARRIIIRPKIWLGGEERQQKRARTEPTAQRTPEDQEALRRQAQEARGQWLRKFLQGGGFDYLYNLLLNVNSQTLLASRLGKRCLALVLRLVIHFMTDPEPVSALRAEDEGREESKDADYDGGEEGKTSNAKEESAPQDGSSDAAAAITRLETFGRAVDFDALTHRLLEVMQLATDAADEERRRIEARAAARLASGQADDDEPEETEENEGKDINQPSKNAIKKKKDLEEAVSSDAEQRTTEAEIVERSVGLLVNVLATQPTSLETMYQFPGVETTFLHGLLATEERSVRAELHRGIVRLCRALDAKTCGDSVSVLPRDFFLPCLVNHSVEAYRHPERCSEFFRLLADLIALDMRPVAGGVEEAEALSKTTAGTGTRGTAPAIATTGSSKVPKDPTLCWPAEAEVLPDARPLPFDAQAFAASLAHRIAQHPTVEVAPDDSDLVLRGLLRVTRALVARLPELKPQFGRPRSEEGGFGTLDTVFENGLFHQPSPDAPADEVNPPQCKSARSRLAALQLLSELTRDCPENLLRLFRCVGAHHAPPSSVLATPSSGGKASGAASDDGIIDMGPGMSEVRVFSDTRRGGTGRGRGYWFDREEEKSSTGYVGLVNLGCICYMNSSMQQLYMIPAFRRGVLAFPAKIPRSLTDPTAPRTAEDDEAEEDVMFQLQRMFAHLQESNKQAYSPEDWCKAFKDWDGQPVNVMEQRDVTEYLTQLFQTMEGKIQGTPQEKLINDVLGGTQVDEFIAEKCRLYRGRETAFSYLTVPVMHVRTLAEGLAAATQGDQLDDYRWEDDDTGEVLGKFNTTKRMSIKTAPPYLAVCLRRFDFDLDRGVQVKLNSYFEFPERLNLFPYTVQGRSDAVKGDGPKRHMLQPKGGSGEEDGPLEGDAGAAGAAEAEVEADEADDPSSSTAAAAAEGAAEGRYVDDPNFNPYAEPLGPEHYEYDLTGVVVHVGSAQSGHYYSFIQERGKGGPTGRWFEFNDAWVSDWDPSKLKEDCFGGEEEVQQRGYYANVKVGNKYVRQYQPGATFKRVRSNNAFLLFYDKVDPDRARERIRKLGVTTALETSSNESSQPASGAGGASVPAVSPEEAEILAGTRQVAAKSPEPAAPRLTSSKSTGGGMAGGNEAASAAASAVVDAEGRGEDPVVAFAKQVAVKQQEARSAQIEVRAPVPQPLLEDIRCTNAQHWRKRNILRSDYFAFMRRLVRHAAPPRALTAGDNSKSSVADSKDEAVDAGEIPVTVGYPSEGIADAADAVRRGGTEVSVAQTTLAFVMFTLSSPESPQRGDAPVWIRQLIPLVRSNLVVAAWLLQTLLADPTLVQTMLIEHREEDTRSALADLIAEAMAALLPHETIAPVDEVRDILAQKPSAGVDGNAEGVTTVPAKVGSDKVEVEGPVIALTAGQHFRAPAGKIVVTFVVMLLEKLPTIQRHTMTFSDYFQVLRSFADYSGDTRQFLLDQGLVSMLCDFLMEGLSPHPELIDQPGGYAPSDMRKEVERSAVGSVYRAPTFEGKPFRPRMQCMTHVMDQVGTVSLLGSLLEGSLPWSNAENSPYQQPPAQPLTDLDREMLDYPKMRFFLIRMLGHSSSTRSRFGPLLHHLLWGDRELSDTYIDSVGRGIENNDFDKVGPYFFTAEVLAGMTDDRAQERTAALLERIVTAMRENILYFRVTVKSIRQFIRIVRRNPSTHEWVRAHVDDLEWMEQWLVNHPTAPSPYAYSAARNKLSLVKPGTPIPYSQTPRYPDTLPQLQHLLRGEFAFDSGYDSDEPEAMLGKRVRVCVSHAYQFWLRATVHRHLPERNLHEVLFDDEEERDRSPLVNFRYMQFEVLPDDAPIHKGPDLPPKGDAEKEAVAAAPLPANAPDDGYHGLGEQDDEDDMMEDVGGVGTMWDEQ